MTPDMHRNNPVVYVPDRTVRSEVPLISLTLLHHPKPWTTQSSQYIARINGLNIKNYEQKLSMLTQSNILRKRSREIRLHL